ncbi:MAG TPA: acyl carrier protein [Acidobacteriota bacterium]|jgi:acyl carrier protein
MRNSAIRIRGCLAKSVTISTADIHSLITELFLRTPQKAMLRPDTDLLASGICDSMGMMDLALEIEKRYGLRIRDQEVNRANLGSIQRILNFISSKGVATAE